MLNQVQWQECGQPSWVNGKIFLRKHRWKRETLRKGATATLLEESFSLLWTPRRRLPAFPVARVEGFASGGNCHRSVRFRWLIRACRVNFFVYGFIHSKRGISLCECRLRFSKIARAAGVKNVNKPVQQPQPGICRWGGGRSRLEGAFRASFCAVLCWCLWRISHHRSVFLDFRFYIVSAKGAANCSFGAFLHRFQSINTKRVVIVFFLEKFPALLLGGSGIEADKKLNHLSFTWTIESFLFAEDFIQ